MLSDAEETTVALLLADVVVVSDGDAAVDVVAHNVAVADADVLPDPPRLCDNAADADAENWTDVVVRSVVPLLLDGNAETEGERLADVEKQSVVVAESSGVALLDSTDELDAERDVVRAALPLTELLARDDADTHAVADAHEDADGKDVDDALPAAVADGG